MRKKRNVGRKASLGRHHKENVGRYMLHDQHQKFKVKPNRGMTKYEKLQIKLEMACLALGG